MKANRLLLAAALAAASLSIVSVDAHAQGKSGFDRKGWVLVGQKQVDGAKDRDVIQVGRKKLGPFSKVMVVVEDSDLEITDLEIEFGNGQKVNPNLKHVFKEGNRTRAIDLPGEKRHIARIALRYGNLPGGGKARVMVFGKQEEPGAENGGPAPVPPTEPGPVGVPGGDRFKAHWDRGGWVKLGEKVVNGKADHDVVPVGLEGRPFTKIMLVVEDSDLELHDVEVHFANGTSHNPKLKHFFRGEERTRPIDLPGEARNIESIDLRYGNVPGGGRAHVEVWGREIGGPAGNGNTGVVPPHMRPRGPQPIVADFWPRRAAAGAKMRIQGRRFAPGLQVVFGDVVVDPTIDGPFMMTVAVPAGLKGKVPVMLRNGDRDLPVGIFTVGGADDHAKIRARMRAEAEKWWKLRERQLAKDAAEREAALAKAEAELAAAREKRREERLAKLRAKWKAELLAREEARIELALHAERAARLARMQRLAETAGNGGLVIRVHFLVGIEDARHEARMGDLVLVSK